MNFVSAAFLGFFAVVFAVYWSLPHHRWRLLWLLGASCLFYMSWNPWFILLLFASTSTDYLVATRLEQASTGTLRRLLVLLSVCVNLGILAFFKYAVFALDTSRTVCNALGVALPVPALKVILPLGISFYTFEAISYIVDVYRGKIQAIRQPLDYALYILFFPHLVAGPIVRSGDFLPQLARKKRFSWLRLEAGVRLFVLGLVKKAVIADHVAAVIDPVFADPAGQGSLALWLATLGYAVQIYGDFSGYSDMAVGLAHTLGFKLPANFRMPYFASGPSDFWRRWHVSLSGWLRDYLYIPLGGSRGGTWQTCRNLMLTMTLGGLWHGANWTFIVWGAYHGLLLVAQRLARLPAGWQRALRPAGVAGTFLAVCVGWVFFRAQSLGDAAVILRGLLGGAAGAGLAPEGAQIVVACLAAVFLGHLIGTFGWLRTAERRLPVPLAGAALAAALTLYLLLLPDTAKGFIYFQF
jgi:alginate O-acetyltransferase complex protein AlgI